MSLPNLWSLRILLPAITALLALAAGAAQLVLDLRQIRDRSTREITGDAWAASTPVHSNLERFYRHGDLTGVDVDLAWTATHPLAAGAAVIGADGVILAATHVGWRGRPAREALPQPLTEGLGEGPLRAGHVAPSAADPDIIVARFPIQIGARRGLRAHEGTLVMAFDMTRHLETERRAAWSRFASSMAAIGALAVVIGMLLNTLVSRRAHTLVLQANAIAAGDLAARTHVRGKDELAALGRALNEMGEELSEAASARSRVEAELLAAEARLQAWSTELERRVAERTEELTRLVQVLDASTDLVAIRTMNGRVVYANAALRKLLADRGLDVTASRIDDFRKPEAAALIQEVAIPSALRHGSWLGETSIPTPTGEIAVSQLIQVHEDEEGRPRYLSTIMRDITVIKQKEAAIVAQSAELSRVNAELAKAARLKDEFLASMSHELRTPLNAVLGYSQALQEELFGPLSSEQVSAARDIEQSGRHLLALINDILDLSKIEAGEIKLDMTPVDVPAVCEASLRLVREQAHHKQLRLSKKISPDIHIALLDERRVKQILVNLLGNAVKFTPNGGAIGLDVTLDRERDEVVMVVHDTGIGIRREDMGLLFRPFQQIDSRLSREYEGTGLGLALVARLASLHGGAVSVESEPGAGSRFTVRIPFRPMSEAACAAPSRASLRPSHVPPGADAPRILLVDDNELSSRILGRFLGGVGYGVLVADNGRRAIEIARVEHPALILMDIQMPHMDGLEATRRLRADPATRAIPVVAVTALAMAGDRERCIEAGVTAYVTKPINLDALEDMVRQITSAGAPSHRPSGVEATSPEPARVKESA